MNASQTGFSSVSASPLSRVQASAGAGSSGPDPVGGGSSLGPMRPVYGSAQDAFQLRQELTQILQEGRSYDLAAAPHVDKLVRYLGMMQPGQLESLKGLINAAQTRLEQIFILKAFAANEPWANLVQFAVEMRGVSEGEIFRRATMRDEQDLIQQWQDACGPTVLQSAAGEADPRYAWELNKSWSVSQIDPLGNNSALAAQQRAWLEQYGGKAVLRGEGGGLGISISRMLNENLTPITGAQYATVPIGDQQEALARILATLQQGYDVPLRVSWDPPSAGDGTGHFVLAMAVRSGTYGRELQIHDPWTGKSTWVAESTLLADRMDPIFGSYARLTHYYQPSPA
ncbi:MAG: hypothetical protein VKP62_08360 [Candidatus Sericytochromatia bacterium]|nr:hypothetical protein [Candidatus Sericytochromatia bacterium]